jgi:thiamine pyrophosphate-dependent acetolactate synthase large subunit-like protein
VFARACKNEGLAALFCCPGNYTVINSISAAGIPAYGGRIEDIMCAAADGFSRVTGEVTATSGTEGPGFTNMIMSIASAHRAHSPVLVLASNMAMSNEDRIGGIQQMYQQPTTEGIKKYGKRITIPNRVHEYAAYAFRQLKSGVPGPVHLDFPSEVSGARFKDASELKDFFDKSRYRTECVANPAPKDVATAVDMIQKSERPMIVAGQGVFFHKGWDALKRLAEKNEVAVVESAGARALRRASPVGEPGGRRARQRRPRDLRRTVPDAERRRVPLQSGCEGDSHSSGRRRPGSQLAARSRHRLG